MREVTGHVPRSMRFVKDAHAGLMPTELSPAEKIRAAVVSVARLRQ